MKTVQIVKRTHKQNNDLIKLLYIKYLRFDKKFHYFYEPDLIIRTDKYKEIGNYLKKRKIEYQKYAYPYTKSGWGESKKWKDIQKLCERLYNLQAICALTIKNDKQTQYITNRFHHCFLNMKSFEYYGESKYYLRQAQGYMKHQYESDGKISTLILYKLMSLLSKLV